MCQSLHHHVARRCTCGQRALRASVCAFFFLNTSSWVSLPWSTWTPHTTAFGAGAQCAMLHLRPQARRLAASSYIACRVKFVFPRRRLTHLCRKPRVPRWRLHICVRSRARGQNSGSYRSLRPNWLFNSPSSSTSQTRQSRHLPFVRRCTATFLASDDTACQWGETRKSTTPYARLQKTSQRT